MENEKIIVIYKTIFNKTHTEYFDTYIFASWYVEDLKKNPLIVNVKILGKNNETK